MPLSSDGTVFLTGATGFIGSHLLDTLLEKGIQTTVLVRDKQRLWQSELDFLTIIEGDLSQEEALLAGCEQADLVINLAGLTAANKLDDFYRVNVLGAENVAKAARVAPKKPTFIHISSQAAVGPSFNNESCTEETAARPISEYGRSKLKSEGAVREAFGEEAIILRPTIVYGPRDKELLPLFTSVKWGVFPILCREAKYTWTFVSDVVDGILAAANKGQGGGIYNVAASEKVDMVSLYEAFRNVFKSRPIKLPIPQFLLTFASWTNEMLHLPTGRTPVFNRGKVGELLAVNWLADGTKAKRELEFTARVGLMSGLEKTYNWYKAHGWL